jgi:hypothetical protein
MSFINEEEITEEVLDELIDQVEEANEEPEEEFIPEINFDDVSKALDWDLLKKEPDRKKHDFALKDDTNSYKGIVLKKIDSNSYIFMIEGPERKMKKIKVDLIESFI